MPIHNSEIAELFNRFAILLEIKGDDPFTARSYRGAARIIANLPREITEMLRDRTDLSLVPGIGSDLAATLWQIVTTQRFAELDALKRALPEAIAELADVPGLGPKKLRTLFDTLNLQTLEQVVEAAREGRLRELPGFGPRTEANILKAALRHTAPRPVPMPDAEAVARPLAVHLRALPGVVELEIGGSYRRRCRTVSELDILVTCDQASPVVQVFTRGNMVRQVLAQGKLGASVRLCGGLQASLRILTAQSFGAALLHSTGSQPHLFGLMAYAHPRGLKLNEHGLFRGNHWQAGRSEADVYGALGLPVIPPELREDDGEIEAALTGTLPVLVTANDLKGDMGCIARSAAAVEKMAAAAQVLGYGYLVITAQPAALGGDVPEVSALLDTIDAVNARQPDVRLLKRIDAEILADGTLKAGAADLSRFDIVTGTVVAGYGLSRGGQTIRLLRALENPWLSALAHPACRSGTSREPIDLDLGAVLHEAQARGCFLEIGPYAAPFDCTESQLREARAMGVKFVLASSADSPEQLGMIRFALAQARRGWLEAGDIVNTQPLGALYGLLHKI